MLLLASTGNALRFILDARCSVLLASTGAGSLLASILHHPSTTGNAVSFASVLHEVAWCYYWLLLDCLVLRLMNGVRSASHSHSHEGRTMQRKSDAEEERCYTHSLNPSMLPAGFYWERGALHHSVLLASTDA